MPISGTPRSPGSGDECQAPGRKSDSRPSPMLICSVCVCVYVVCCVCVCVCVCVCYVCPVGQAAYVSLSLHYPSSGTRGFHYLPCGPHRPLKVQKKAGKRTL